jgi:hypothetical protein
MPNKHNADRRHHFGKMKFKVRNSASYEAGLRRRGGLTLWGVCFTFGASQLAGLCTGSIYRIKQDEKISMGARAKSSGQHGRAKRGRLGHYG